MTVFLVLYMEAEKNRLKTISFPFGAFMVKNSKNSTKQVYTGYSPHG